MIGALALALLVPQDASGSLGKFHWPPAAAAEAASYRIELMKARVLDDATRKAERDARKNAGRYAPARPPKQEIAVTVLAELTPGEELIAGRYSIELGRSSLRWKLTDADPAPDETVAFHRLWGLPDDKRADRPPVPRALVATSFEHKTRRDAPTARPVGAPDPHLLPVFWEGALPCWVEHVIAIVELADVSVVAGKSLIRDRIVSDPLGQRTERAKVTFVTGSSSTIEFEYELTIDQRIDPTRVDHGRIEEPYAWHIDVVGKTAFSLTHGRFERIDETVTGRLIDPPAEKLADLRDESFRGRIQLEHVAKPSKPERRPRRRAP